MVEMMVLHVVGLISLTEGIRVTRNTNIIHITAHHTQQSNRAIDQPHDIPIYHGIRDGSY